MSNTPDIATPVRTQAILNRYHLLAKKSLGQNFLTDVDVLHQIVDVANISDQDDVIEIGPGIGGLTEQLARSAHKVLGFEIDDKLIPVLHETLSPYNNVKIINEDILQANLPKIIKEEFDSDHQVKVVANLPYYITTPIILDLLKGNADFDAIVVMMQKEVANRLTAKPGIKAYGSLSVIIQYLNDAEIALNVPRSSFIPSPHVDSAIVKLTGKKELKPIKMDQDIFFGFVRGCFAHRRKTLWNNLKTLFGNDADVKKKVQQVLDQLNIKPQIRPGKLSIDDFVNLANQFNVDQLLKS
ncbi:ribosomal RNA small subunit methyltransferase A [Philodulcilactobacillus myokoensis]|uniref:Ribosomal RNA small subunit methyltransferase A n=1 Tax=Philodulcilactobacillus myokoensis TaxID=2929573 RepID=A0A9W6B1L5_9LACO|nr:16S rRNA (adenine(1518)-N(6)/adenine(1519)-N(6))-dimethyltransferase RsmA [Philodulcilactobacillus myokoensis]GLB47230.1 ribosomal RNA small subunit methyltransferase A [Philodulcilactobacillus myokoensis]